jgi:hypothetical protein
MFMKETTCICIGAAFPGKAAQFYTQAKLAAIFRVLRFVIPEMQGQTGRSPAFSTVTGLTGFL